MKYLIFFLSVFLSFHEYANSPYNTMLENNPRSCEGKKETAGFCLPPFPPNTASHKSRVIFAFLMQGAKALCPQELSLRWDSHPNSYCYFDALALHIKEP